jgi:hypothetical protein
LELTQPHLHARAAGGDRHRSLSLLLLAEPFYQRWLALTLAVCSFRSSGGWNQN